MLNSSEQRLMEVISNVWVQVNKTGRELWEETTKLRMAENSSQEEIQRVRVSYPSWPSFTEMLSYEPLLSVQLNSIVRCPSSRSKVQVQNNISTRK